MLQMIKDKTLSKGVQIAINKQIEAYGKVAKLNLNSKNKNIEMEVVLDGEIEPLILYVDNYSLTKMDGVHQLEVNGVHTSRTWINTVASAYLEGKAFEIPNEYAKMLKAVI